LCRTSAWCCLLLSFIAIAATGEPVWTVSRETGKTGDRLVFASTALTVKLTEAQFWTLDSITAGGQELVGPTGANGAVCQISGPAGEKLEDPWIGTGHGKEVVRRFTIVADGNEVTVTPGQTVRGNEIVVTKESNIGPLDQVAVMTFPASGDRIFERATFTAGEDLAKRFRFVYGWMHSTGNGLKQYLVWRTPEKTESGETAGDDGKFHVNGDLRALAQFDPGTGRGIAYVYGDTYKANRHQGTRIWDRKQDNKVYFTPDFSAATLPQGKSATYELTVLPFTGVAADWQAAARRCVDPVIAAQEAARPPK
jgi:hypothetical protein